MKSYWPWVFSQLVFRFHMMPTPDASPTARDLPSLLMLVTQMVLACGSTFSSTEVEPSQPEEYIVYMYMKQPGGTHV